MSSIWQPAVALSYALFRSCSAFSDADGLALAGVIAAAALKCMGGSLQGRLYPRCEEERQKAIEAGYDVDSLLFQDDLCKGEQVRHDRLKPCLDGISQPEQLPDAVQHRLAFPYVA